MTELEKKDLIIKELRELLHDYQLRLVRAGVKLPTDTSTRKKYFNEFIHRQKLMKEKDCKAC